MREHESITVGAEIEKPVASLETGLSHKTSPYFFIRLAQAAKDRGQEPEFDTTDKGTIIGVKTYDLGEQGVDNGYNLLETSLPPQRSLEDLAYLMSLDLKTIQSALEKEGASVINMSIHPLGKRDLETYKAFVAPKGIYPYLWYRGWDHTAGIDARAQNSPTTGVSPEKAADAFSVIIGAGAAFVGLFANSPYEESRRSQHKEARLTMWERMMRYAKVKGDRVTAQFPPERFRTLAQYFNWMFGEGTAIHFIIESTEDGEYKNVGDRILVIPENPSVLEYLSQPEWQAWRLRDIFTNFSPEPLIVKPDISHFEAMQFAQFAGARIRFGLNHKGFPVEEFLAACNQPQKQKVEEIFKQWAKFMYIEGRDPGANFPDRELWDTGDDIAQSVVVAPSALQLGLIRNLEEATSFIDRFNWGFLRDLRLAAIKDGLQGEVDGYSVYDFSAKILEIAAAGLTEEEAKFLAYPEWVLKTKANGADRAIKFVEETQRGKPLPEALANLVKSRQVVINPNQ